MTSSALTQKILLEIPNTFPGSRAWRANVSVAQFKDRVVRAGIPGQADISGIFAPSGRRLEIEVKVGDDNLSDKQEAFGTAIRAAGGIHLVACDERAARRLKRKYDGVFTVVQGVGELVAELERWYREER